MAPSSSELKTLDRSTISEIDTTDQLTDVLAIPEHLRDAQWKVESTNLGRWDSPAGPRLAGDARGASPRILLRAVVESIACRCAEIIRVAERNAPPGRAPGGTASASGPLPVLVAGGLTRCRTLLQAQADLLQRPIVVRESPDATCLGAALLARSPALWWGDGITAPAGGGGRNVTWPRLSSDEAERRYRDWATAVYGAEGATRPGVAVARASR